MPPVMAAGAFFDGRDFRCALYGYYEGSYNSSRTLFCDSVDDCRSEGGKELAVRFTQGSGPKSQKILAKKRLHALTFLSLFTIYNRP